VELDPLDRMLDVPDPHDLAFCRFGAYFKTGRQSRPVDYQRMVPARREGVGKTFKNGAAVVDDGRRLTVHYPWGPHNLPAEGIADGLMTEADAP